MAYSNEGSNRNTYSAFEEQPYVMYEAVQIVIPNDQYHGAAGDKTITIMGDQIDEFNSLADANKQTGIDNSTISNRASTVIKAKNGAEETSYTIQSRVGKILDEAKAGKQETKKMGDNVYDVITAVRMKQAATVKKGPHAGKKVVFKRKHD